jgi:Domain of unknown function (DUF4384)
MHIAQGRIGKLIPEDLPNPVSPNKPTVTPGSGSSDGHPNYRPNAKMGYMMYKLDQSYPSGTRFRCYLTNGQPAYVYVIAADKSMETTQLFPFKGGSAAISYAQATVAIPGEQAAIRMDNTPGTDMFCMLYSKEPLDIEAIKRDISAQTHDSFVVRLCNVLSAKIADPDDITSWKSECRFEGRLNHGATVLPVFVEITHR